MVVAWEAEASVAAAVAEDFPRHRERNDLDGRFAVALEFAAVVGKPCCGQAEAALVAAAAAAAAAGLARAVAVAEACIAVVVSVADAFVDFENDLAEIAHALDSSGSSWPFAELAAAYQVVGAPRWGLLYFLDNLKLKY